MCSQIGLGMRKTSEPAHKNLVLIGSYHKSANAFNPLLLTSPLDAVEMSDFLEYCEK